MKIKKYLLIAILIAAAFLRLWKLGSIPPALTADEASLGYNAYSILKTGRDEYGKFMPVIFKSFGDYKPGLYVYLTVPSVAIFGLTEFATRLPSALAGILSVFLIYLIVRSLFTDHRSLATIVTFVAATNPWLIHFSRGAWEVNVALALTLAGIYFFLRSLENSRFTVHCSLAFALTLITYQGAKLSTGIVVVLLTILYWKDILKIKARYLIFALILAFAVSSPILLSFTKGQTGRLAVFSVFSYPRPKEYLQNFLDQGKESVGSLSYYLFHSESLNFARGVLGRFFNHFSGKFLFFEGDWPNPRHTSPNSGMLLLSDLATLLFGFVFILKSSILNRKSKLFVLLWLVLSPLPSILSRDQVHAIRAINMTIPLIIIISFGYLSLFELLHKRVVKWLFVVFVFLSFAYFSDSYFVHLSKHDSKLWGYGFKQMVQTVTGIQSEFKAIKVQQSFAQPYIYFLFYQKYDPAKYQKNARLTVADSVNDVGYVMEIDNIKFVAIDWQINRGEKGVVFVADSIRIPSEATIDSNLFKVIKEIKYLDGKDIAFRIIEVK